MGFALPFTQNCRSEMGDFQGPLPLLSMSPPPSTSSSLDTPKMPMLYYGLAVVGIVAITLVLYNIVILKWRRMQSQPHEGTNRLDMEGRIQNFQRNLLSSFKYKKEGGNEDYECAICLSGFEEDEEVKKLPRCKHPFHAPCIDMWLYSHFDCPICRTSVVGPFCRRFLPENQNSPP